MRLRARRARAREAAGRAREAAQRSSSPPRTRLKVKAFARVCAYSSRVGCGATFGKATWLRGTLTVVILASRRPAPRFLPADSLCPSSATGYVLFSEVTVGGIASCRKPRSVLSL